MHELGRYAEAQQRAVELLSLRVRNAAVVLTDLDQRRCLDRGDVGDRRRARPFLGGLPGKSFELEGTVFLDVALSVERSQIHRTGEHGGGVEALGLGDGPRGQITA